MIDTLSSETRVFLRTGPHHSTQTDDEVSRGWVWLAWSLRRDNDTVIETESLCVYLCRETDVAIVLPQVQLSIPLTTIRDRNESANGDMTETKYGWIQ